MSGLDILNMSGQVRYNIYRNTTHLAVGKEAALKQSSKNIYANDTAALLLRISREDVRTARATAYKTKNSS